MYTRPPNLYFHTAKLLLLGMLLCIFTAGSAMAAPKVCKKDCPPLPASPGNYVFWGVDASTSDIYQDESRTCNLTLIAEDSSSGTYNCALDSYLVKYDLSSMASEPIHSKGDDSLCLDNGSIFAVPNLQYSYSWTGDCTSASGCDVTIVNHMALYGPIYGFGSMTIQAFASNVTSSDLNEPNPFADAQEILVDYLHVTKFSPKGKDKVLAICKLTPAFGAVTFHTSLVPVTPE